MRDIEAVSGICRGIYICEYIHVFIDKKEIGGAPRRRRVRRLTFLDSLSRASPCYRKC